MKIEPVTRVPLMAKDLEPGAVFHTEGSETPMLMLNQEDTALVDPPPSRMWILNLDINAVRHIWENCQVIAYDATLRVS